MLKGIKKYFFSDVKREFIMKACTAIDEFHVIDIYEAYWYQR